MQGPGQTNMPCPRCGHDNYTTQSFCGQCGLQIDGVCPNCRTHNAHSSQICGHCGFDFVRGSVIRALQQANHTIPIVMRSVMFDPVEAGFVVSLARPGGNITGLTQRASKLHAKRLELFKEAFPRISRVAIIWRPDDQKQSMKEVEAAGQALGVQIQSVLVQRGGLRDIESVVSAISQKGSDGLLVGPSGFMNRNQARFREFTAKSRLPTIYAVSRFVKAGGLMSYGVDLQHLYRRVATYVDKILKGAKPAYLPVEQPTKFELVINLKTAKQLGLTIPPAVLLQATKVIK